jgi:hypothetical protein
MKWMQRRVKKHFSVPVANKSPTVGLGDVFFKMADFMDAADFKDNKISLT